jgi:PAS domain S-box-containing protein
MSQHPEKGPPGAPAPLQPPAGRLARRRADLGEHARFESLLVDLSAAFVNLPADEVDAQIQHALRRIVEFLDLDRGALAELAGDGRKLVTTHSYAVPGVPPSPPALLEDQLPWYAGKIRQGEVLRFTRLPDEAPPEAVAERAYCARVGLKSNLTVPLKVGGSVLGAVGFGSFRAYRPWPDELVQRLRLVGEVLANALARKRSEQALRASERRYREMVETTQAVPWEADAETFRVRYIGPQAVRLLGYPAEDWYRDGFWASRLHPDDRERVLRAASEAVRRGEHFEQEYRMVSATGEEVWVRDLVTAPLGAGGPPALRGVMVDVTARKSAEEEAHRLRDQLAHVARVTTVGELAAAIAHEVNQPLCAILGNAQAAQRLLASDSPDLAEVGEALRDIVAGGRRARDVIARIRGLLQNRRPEPAPVDLNEATREAVALLQHRLTRKGVDLSLDLSADLPPVLGDRVQLQQVLLNLLVNAIEAMAAAARPRELSVRSARDEAGTVIVSVRDSGPGIAPEHAGRAFDPFFTTKPGGLGVGLAISRSIVAAHGGRIWAESNAARGAAFHFSLPAAKGAPP